MKFILLVVTVLALVYLVRGSLRRLQQPRETGTDATDAGAPQPMSSCAQCGLHLPRDEALPGRGGVFCSAPHRAAYEAAHPSA